ncbi:MAG: hypothetical protein ACD_22C00082G0020 [uncultured bacterium]|nr:MAG: hypothetical protein ACD_22C00082G0020 [uncultured bacterium]
MSGRPSKMTETRLGKLRQAFMLGCSDVEACLYANIHPDTLYAYQSKNPKYSEEKERLKMNPVLMARQTVIKAIGTDAKIALKFLERKKKDEFSPKQSIDINDNAEPITGITYLVPEGYTL